MRVAITGDRYWFNDGTRKGPVDEHADLHRRQIRAALATLDRSAFVVLGDARGVDSAAREICDELGLSYRVHYADWSGGPRGGPLRNQKMLDDLVGGAEVFEEVYVWWFHDDLPHSKGTKSCVEKAMRQSIPVRDGRKVGNA